MNLTYYSEFKKILENYKVSGHAAKILQDLRLVLLIAPTSAGRNTIIRHKLKTGRYFYIVSDTTRPPRINDGVPEQNGKEYWFRPEQEVLADLKAGEYLEAEIIHEQQVSGISIRELEKARNENKIAITDIDIGGMHNIMKAKPDTVAIMLIPPSFEEWQRRLVERGKMTSQEQNRRFETALRIFEDGHRQVYYNFVISEDIEQSAAIIDAIVGGKPNPHQERGSNLLQWLETSLKDKLNTTNQII